jgi:NAD(P)-dependent dehydrogenase (short-subunit alcohol dehydrogenase family)
LETAKYLAKNNPELHVVLACRNALTANAAVSSIKTLDPQASLEYLALDLGSLESIRTFGNVCKEQMESGKMPPISSIIFNAATVHESDTYTKDGFESTFGCNHLGHFLLLHLLLRLIDPNYPTRIVFVSSSVHDEREGAPVPKPNFKLNIDQMAHPEKDTRNGSTVGGERYSTSKLCNILTTVNTAVRIDNHLPVARFCSFFLMTSSSTCIVAVVESIACDSGVDSFISSVKYFVNLFACSKKTAATHL